MEMETISASSLSIPRKREKKTQRYAETKTWESIWAPYIQENERETKMKKEKEMETATVSASSINIQREREETMKTGASASSTTLQRKRKLQKYTVDVACHKCGYGSSWLDTEGDNFYEFYNEVLETFVGMHLKGLGKDIFEYGYEKPSVIKRRGIKTLPEGVWKRTTFCIGILRKIDLSLLKCQCLVIAPDEGSVMIIRELIKILGRFLAIKVHGCHCVLKDQPHVVVGLPLDVLNINNLCHKHIRMVVLDNKDVMLQGEHLKYTVTSQIYEIFRCLPSDVEVGVSSETMGVKDLRITCRSMLGPVRIPVKRELTLTGIKHFFTRLYKEREKKEVARDFIVQSFWSGGSGIVITDLEARGGEFGAFVVINYDLPIKVDTYIRRVGRSVGKGIAINFSTKNDWYRLLDIQRMYGTYFNVCPSTDDLSLIDWNEAVEGFSTRLGTGGDKFYQSYDKVCRTFDSMNLEENIVKGIHEYGYAKPSKIQQRGIEPLCKGFNVIAQADNEPGRTVTFCTWILQKLDYSSCCQCLVLTRSFRHAEEVVYVMRELGRFLKGLEVHAVRGGAFLSRKMANNIKKGAHVVVGDPSTVLALLQSGSITFDIKMCVLDEAGILLSHEIHTVRNIFKLLSPTVQVGVFSQKISPLVVEFTRECVHDPFGVVVKQDKVNLEGIKHFVVNVKQAELKLDTLLNFFRKVMTIESSYDIKCVIFTNSNHGAHLIADKLGVNKTLSVVALPKLMSWSHREGIMRRFRDGDINVIIFSDPFDRGFELSASLVINYDVPPRPETYLEVVGRYGRGGAVITFAVDDDWWWLIDEIQCNCRIDLERLPTAFAYVLLKRMSEKPTPKMLKLKVKVSIEKWRTPPYTPLIF